MSDHLRRRDHLRVAALHRCAPRLCLRRRDDASVGRLIAVPSGLLEASVQSVLNRKWAEDDTIPVVHYARHGSAAGDPGVLWVSEGSISMSELLAWLQSVLPMPAEELDAGRPKIAKGFEALKAAIAALYAVLTGALSALDDFIRTWLGKTPKTCP